MNTQTEFASTAQTDTNTPLWHQPPANAFEMLEQANLADPETHPWCYLAWHHGFGCGPITIGIFLFFASQEEMLQSLVQGEVRMEMNSELDADDLAGIAEMKAIADQVARGELETTAACEAFSKPFGFLSLEWFGRFEELASGHSEFARDIRETFRCFHGSDNEAGAEVDAPITAAEMESFIDKLRIWGA